MRTPTTAQLLTALEVLKQLDERIDNHVIPATMQVPDARLGEDYSARIESKSFEQIDRVKTVMAQLENWRDELSWRGGSVLRSMFKTGQALPLVLTRFLCPRISRGEYLKGPRDIDRLWPQSRQIREQEQSENRTLTRSMRVREQSMSAVTPCPQSRSQTVRIRERITVSTVREQALATDTSRPQTVRSLELSTSVNSSRSRILRELQRARNAPRRRIRISTWSPARFPIRIRIIPFYVRI
jgi:hypothetical protein